MYIYVFWFSESQHNQEIGFFHWRHLSNRLFQIALAWRQRKSISVKVLFILKGNILFVILIGIHSWVFRKFIHNPKLAPLFNLNNTLKNFSKNTRARIHTHTHTQYSEIFCPTIYHQITFRLSKGLSSEYTYTEFIPFPLKISPR